MTNTHRTAFTLADWDAANERAEGHRDLARQAEAKGLGEAAEMLWRMAAEHDLDADTIFDDLVARGIAP